MPLELTRFCRLLERHPEVSCHAGLTDRELLARYCTAEDQSAFAVLVARHGDTIFGTCRRALGDAHAAEDAFQATFLILARKANRRGWGDSVGGWLYKVAGHVCRNLARRNRGRCGSLPGEPESRPVPGGGAGGLSAELDRELLALPVKYREAIVLCHLQGLTVDEASRYLGCTAGQLRGWLHRGRERLRIRLQSRGVSVSATALVVALAQSPAYALPRSLASGTIPGGMSAGATVSQLASEVVSMMFKIQAARAAAVAAVLLAIGVAGFHPSEVRAGKPAPAARWTPSSPALRIRADDDKTEKKYDVREGKIVGVDASNNRLTIETEEDGFKMEVELGADTKIEVARQPVKLGELRPGMEGKVLFDGAAKHPFKLAFGWPEVEAVLKTLDPAKKTGSVALDSDRGIDAEAILPILPGAAVTFDGIPAGLDDVPLGKKVKLELAADKKTIAGFLVSAEEGDIPAHVAAVGSGGKSVTVDLEASNERSHRRVSLAFPLAETVKVRILGKDAAAGDLKADMPVVLRLDADRRTVVAVWAGAPEDRKDDD
jgi:RNA polymerase sigma factor (sigma-70 family)